ncbi:MAG: hypothetical protein JO308_14105 [Verrucomicrobia bacterium]|nr:hypothetical protein [Verrucomicrobiota bacterium]
MPNPKIVPISASRRFRAENPSADSDRRAIRIALAEERVVLQHVIWLAVFGMATVFSAVLTTVIEWTVSWRNVFLSVCLGSFCGLLACLFSIFRLKTTVKR